MKMKIIFFKMRMEFIALFGLLNLINMCLCARILGVFPIPSISHQVVFRGLIDELAKRGHHIVIITPDPLGASAPPHYKNVTEIDVHELSYAMMRASFDGTSFRNNSDNMLLTYFDWSTRIADAQLSSPAVKEFLNDRNQHFDLVFAEALLPLSYAFGPHFKAPVIGVSSLTGTLSSFEAVGSPTHPLLYVDIWRRYGGRLTFWQKIATLKTDLIQRYKKYMLTPWFDEILRKHFGDGIPSIFEIENQMEMLFINQHPILGPRPTVPAVVYMGNMHIKPHKPLPKDLKKKLDLSPRGVIYFSLGTNVLSKNLPMWKINIMLQAFSELKYTILWKFENDTLPGLPENVHISKWFPQMDVLGHPNVKAFITQGGQQSLEEAIHNKVPIIGIPFMVDQDLNIFRIVELGAGVSLEIDSLSKDNFKEAIVKVAEGDSFHKNMEKLSDLIADQPMTGKERAVWWTEYVLRHGTARHLRAPAADITWYEYFMVDVLGPLIVLAFTILQALFYTLKKIFNVIVYMGSEKNPVHMGSKKKRN